MSSLKDCTLCYERRYARAPVPGEGPYDAAVCFLGRNPGHQEDRDCSPFRGIAGKMLDNYFPRNLRREKCRITNIVKCMTPSGVVPSKTCIRNCIRTWLAPELSAMQELQVIVPLGNLATHFFEPDFNISRLHGAAFGFTIDRRRIEVFPAYHPSYACRSFAGEQDFANDMQKLQELLEAKGIVHE